MKKTIWYLPIEPLEQRYTKDWLTQFPEVFREKFNVKVILGEFRKQKLNKTFFLDPINTNVWKTAQLKNLLVQFKKIRTGDVIFIGDGWFPGIEILAYVRDMTGLNFKIMAYWHAGTYDRWDLTTQHNMGKWAKELEETWFKIYDFSFVATEYHKTLIRLHRKVDKNKIMVVGFPLDINKIVRKYRKGKTGYGIYFTGRKSIEKGYPIVQELRKIFPITISLEKTKTKDEYYTLMNKHSFILAPSKQETFGIGIIEGMALGLMPIVPDRLAFRETVPKQYRYKTKKEENRLRKYLSSVWHLKCIKKKFDCIKKYQYQTVIRNIMKYF